MLPFARDTRARGRRDRRQSRVPRLPPFPCASAHQLSPAQRPAWPRLLRNEPLVRSARWPGPRESAHPPSSTPQVAISRQQGRSPSPTPSVSLPGKTRRRAGSLADKTWSSDGPLEVRRRTFPVLLSSVLPSLHVAALLLALVW